MKHRNDAGSGGFTLVELMIGVAVVAVLLAVAVPSFQALIERQRLKGAGELVLSELQFARSEAIKQNTQVDVVFDGEGTADWCYGIDDDLSSECDCEESPADCTVAGEVRVVSNAGDTSSFPGVVLDTVDIGDETGFAPPRGFSTDSGRIELTGPTGDTIQVRISNTGRVSACSDNFFGYPTC